MITTNDLVPPTVIPKRSRVVDTSDIPDTPPGTKVGRDADIFERARARARRGERSLDPGPTVRPDEDAVILRLDGELARRMKASGPERADAALWKAFPG